MTGPDNRASGRSSIFLIVNFRRIRGSNEYILGISNNFSSKGMSIESQNPGYGPGEMLELVLKHPNNDTSVSVTGKIVWKNDGWYKSVLGIEYVDMDPQTEDRISMLMSSVMESLPESMLPNETDVKPGATEQGPADTRFSANVNKEPYKEEGGTGTKAVSDREYLVGAVSELNKPAGKESGKAKSGNPVVSTQKRTAQVQDKDTASPLKIKAGQNKDSFIMKRAADKRPKSKFRAAAIVLTILMAVSASTMSIKDVRETVLTYIQDVRSVLPENIYGKEHLPAPSPRFSAAVVQDSGQVQLPVDTPDTVHAVIPDQDTDIIADRAVVPAETDDNVYGREVTEQTAVTGAVHAEAPTPEASEEPEAEVIKSVVTFSTNSVTIDPSFNADIDKITEALSADPESFIRIESHTDDVGSGVYNIDLSMRRALEAKKLLNQKGIESRKIKIILFGDSSPIASNDTESGRRQNRRVEIRLVRSGDQ